MGSRAERGTSQSGRTGPPSRISSITQKGNAQWQRFDIAIYTKDAVKLAKFYEESFGMRVLSKEDYPPGTTHMFLSDGYMNLALICKPNGPERLDHFGFQVDDIEAAVRGALTAGAAEGNMNFHAAHPGPQADAMRAPEVFIRDPEGTRVDVSTADWHSIFADAANADPVRAS